MYNKNFDGLSESYLFSNISSKVKAFKAENPEMDIISLGIGDVTRPLVPTVVNAMQKAVSDMAKGDTFRGYGPEQGYPFLRQAIADDYAQKGVELSIDEIFISDGAKSDVANILDIFETGITAAIATPSYPVYVDSNIMHGNNIVYLDGNRDNNFLPMPDNLNERADLIYLCSPNNPTGAVYGFDALKKWVDYAVENKSVIIFDSAYERFISDDLPKSIFQVNGAEKCAIEICSFSKTAGFTGVRCGYTVVPRALERDNKALNKFWLRRQTTKFNGVGYIVQRGAEAVFSEEGRKQCGESIAYYKNNAKIISDALSSLDVYFAGGINAPYIWLNCGCDSWEFFDRMLNIGIVGTAGSGFGESGDGYFRLTAFSTRENTEKAVKRIVDNAGKLFNR